MCGDGIIVAADEGCDDGNTVDGDGCSSVCLVESGFNCSGEPSVCGSICGNGIVASNQGCDDGNNIDGDGCSSTCSIESGFVCAGEPSYCSFHPNATLNIVSQNIEN